MSLRWWFGAGLLAVGLSLGGCYPTANLQDEEKNPYFVAGKDHVAAQDYPGAIEAFEKALEVNPRSALAHYELGVLYEQRENDYPAAIYHYNRVLKLRPQGAYPAENAKQRIPGCKLEMLKNDTLATLNPAAMREIERLRKDNQQLRQEVDSWAAWWKRNAARLQQPYVPAQPASTSGTARAAAPLPAGGAPAAEARVSGAGHAATPRRSHKVQAGETLHRIAGQYGISVEALLAANPGLNPRRLKPGQSVTIP